MTSKDTTKLKPCPFCGGDIIMEKQSAKMDFYDFSYIIYPLCVSCGAARAARYKIIGTIDDNGCVVIKRDDSEIAIRDWNERR